jgi:hypothetical protein
VATSLPPENVAETKRRHAVFERVHAGEITNSEAVAELGLTVGAWSAWMIYRSKLVGRAVANDTRATSEPYLATRLARLDELERFRIELRHRIRDLLALVEK